MVSIVPCFEPKMIYPICGIHLTSLALNQDLKKTFDIPTIREHGHLVPGRHMRVLVSYMKGQTSEAPNKQVIPARRQMHRRTPEWCIKPTKFTPFHFMARHFWGTGHCETSALNDPMQDRIKHKQVKGDPYTYHNYPEYQILLLFAPNFTFSLYKT